MDRELPRAFEVSQQLVPPFALALSTTCPATLTFPAKLDADRPVHPVATTAGEAKTASSMNWRLTSLVGAWKATPSAIMDSATVCRTRGGQHAWVFRRA